MRFLVRSDDDLTESAEMWGPEILEMHTLETGETGNVHADLVDILPSSLTSLEIRVSSNRAKGIWARKIVDLVNAHHSLERLTFAHFQMGTRTVNPDLEDACDKNDVSIYFHWWHGREEGQYKRGEEKSWYRKDPQSLAGWDDDEIRLSSVPHMNCS
jgi:hypothetical protein